LGQSSFGILLVQAPRSAAYRKIGMPAEIKFSPGAKHCEEAVLRCQEENL